MVGTGSGDRGIKGGTVGVKGGGSVGSQGSPLRYANVPRSDALCEVAHELEHIRGAPRVCDVRDVDVVDAVLDGRLEVEPVRVRVTGAARPPVPPLARPGDTRRR